MSLQTRPVLFLLSLLVVTTGCVHNRGSVRGATPTLETAEGLVIEQPFAPKFAHGMKLQNRHVNAWVDDISAWTNRIRLVRAGESEWCVDYERFKLPETNRFLDDENPLEGMTLALVSSDGHKRTNPTLTGLGHDVRRVRFVTTANVVVGSIGQATVREWQRVGDVTDVHVYSGLACFASPTNATGLEWMKFHLTRALGTTEYLFEFE